MMTIEEIKQTFKEREEWVVEGSKMYEAIESMLNILENQPMYKFNEENCSLDNVYGNKATTQEIKKFVDFANNLRIKEIQKKNE